MAYRWKGKYYEVNPDDPRATGICDRTGFRFNLHKLQWQYAYQGSPIPQNTRFLIAPQYIDPLNPQFMAYILPDDPPPILNARTENYVVDETNWLTTQDNEIIDTQSGEDLIQSLPNPAPSPPAVNLTAALTYHLGSVATAYVDLFSGNPLTTGVSVLSTLTGSATRVNAASVLTTVSGIAENTSAVVLTTACVAMPNINYVGIYDAAAAGNLLVSGQVSLSAFLSVGMPVQFDALGLTINLN